MRSVNHSGIEKISSVGGEEEGKNMSVAKRRSGGGLEGGGERGEKECH